MATDKDPYDPRKDDCAAKDAEGINLPTIELELKQIKAEVRRVQGRIRSLELALQVQRRGRPNA